MIRNVIFDLDGTLSDPRAGIEGGLRLAFSQYGIEVEDPEVFREFIGPTLRDHLPRVYPGLGDEKYDAVVRAYRAYYSEKGKFENNPYPGIDELLRSLRAAGLRLAVATLKPRMFAKEILGHFGLAEYFDCIAGLELHYVSSDKRELILECIKTLGALPEETVMVGDREYDILGAHSAGIKCIAVLYGYGAPGEMDAADWVVPSVEGLLELLGGAR